MHWSSDDFSFGTPPCGQIHRQVSKHYLPAVLRTRAVKTIERPLCFQTFSTSAEEYVDVSKKIPSLPLFIYYTLSDILHNASFLQ